MMNQKSQSRWLQMNDVENQTSHTTGIQISIIKKVPQKSPANANSKPAKDTETISRRKSPQWQHES